LSWFLPTEESTKAVVNEMKAQGILAGNFYWYDNNWHYIRKWEHLKQAHTLNALTDAQRLALEKLQTQNFSSSDAIMSRCISSAISLLWTEDQVTQKGENIVSVVKKVLKEQRVTTS
jgi:8-amino-3,8-dideoxy-alpha-D-manno-octulosonate transaminase